MTKAPIPVVAILNSNDDIVELLRMALEQSGLLVVSAHVDQVKRADVSLKDFLHEHKPDVIIYDLVPPYDNSWRFLEHLRQTIAHDHRFVVTSTNPKRASELAAISERDIMEIVGKPYDIEQIVDHVRQAAGLNAAKH